MALRPYRLIFPFSRLSFGNHPSFFYALQSNSLKFFSRRPPCPDLLSDEGCAGSFAVSSTVHPTFSVNVLLPTGEIGETVSRILEADSIIHQKITRLGDFTGDEAVVLYLASTDQTRAEYISSKAFSGRALFLIVPPELEPTACIWWENDFITDFLTTDHLGRLPSAIRRLNRDVSERLEFIETLKAREDQLRLLETAIDNAEDIVLITDAAGKNNPGQHILYVNRAFERETGYSREEVIGKTPRILQGTGTLPETKKILREGIANWESLTVEVLNYRKDGTEFWSELSIVPLFQSDSTCSHWVSVQRDITERKKTERLNQEFTATILAQKEVLESVNLKLQQTDRVKATFTAMLAHDIRSPLTSLRMALDFFQNRHSFSEEDLQEGLTAAQESLQRVLNLTNDLLEVFRSETDEVFLLQGVVSAQALLGKCIREAYLGALSKKVHLVHDIQVEFPLFIGDETKLERVFANLLSNAVKFTPEGGRITVQARLEPGDPPWMAVEIKDTGEGIREDELPFIFDPYRQAMSSQRSLGVGLGLAIAQRIVTAHGGDIRAASHRGEGSTFTVRVPLKG